MRRGVKLITEISALVLASMLAIPSLLFLSPQIIGASGAYVSLSSSMSPSFEAGDLIFVRREGSENIEVCDIITFESGPEKIIVTHRVVEVLNESGETFYRTKGDANTYPDSALVAGENIKGVYFFRIPLYGYLMIIAGSTPGRFLFLIAPAILLIILEIRPLVFSRGKRRDAPPGG